MKLLSRVCTLLRAASVFFSRNIRSASKFSIEARSCCKEFCFSMSLSTSQEYFFESLIFAKVNSICSILADRHFVSYTRQIGTAECFQFTKEVYAFSCLSPIEKKRCHISAGTQPSCELKIFAFARTLQIRQAEKESLQYIYVRSVEEEKKHKALRFQFIFLTTGKFQAFKPLNWYSRKSRFSASARVFFSSSSRAVCFSATTQRTRI